MRYRGRSLALLALPFVAVLVWARWMVPRLADSIARDARVVESLVPSSAPAAAPHPQASPDVANAPSPDGRGEVDAPTDSPSPSGRGVASAAPDSVGVRGQRGERGDGVPAPSARLSVVVPVEAVARAMDQAGETMHARTTRGPDGKPAGVKLTGVSKAKIGLLDGDVIVSVDGKPTMDDDRATEVALAVIGRGDSTLHAVAMRGDQPIDVTLNLPTSTDAGKSR